MTTRWLFEPTGLTAGTTYRIDQYAGWRSPVTITPAEGGAPVEESVLTADASGDLAPFSHTTLGGLWAKPVDTRGAETGIPVAVAGEQEGSITTADLSSTVTDLLGSAAHSSAYAAGDGVRAALRRKLSTTLLTIGDSTGDATTEQFYLLGSLLGDANPDYSVNYRLYGPDGSTEAWGPVVSIQEGPDGPFGVKPASGYPLFFTNANAYTGDFGYRVLVSPTGGWAPGGSAAVRNIISRGVDSSSNRHSKFGLDESGKLVWEWSAAGTSSTNSIRPSTRIALRTSP